MGRKGRLIERERKYRLSDADARALEDKLRDAGAKSRHEIQESIIFKDRASHLRKDTILRMRTVDGRRELTFKGPKKVKGLDKWREELNVEIGEGPALEILDAMGFRPGTRYMKDSLIFEYKKALVSIDRLEGIGYFCEIEVDDLDRDLDKVAEELGLDPDRYEPRGYPTLAGVAVKNGS